MSKVLDHKLKAGLDQLLDIIAANLKAKMGAMTVTELARASGVGKGSIQRILGGSRGYAGQAKSAAQIDTLFRLAWHFNIPLPSLLVRTSTDPTDRTAVVLGQYSPPVSPPPSPLNRR